MELFKNFALGGLFQAGRKMAPPWGAFRRLTNTYKDPTNTFQPYGRGIEEDNLPTLPTNNGAYTAGFSGPISSQFFRKGILQLGCFDNGTKFLGAFSYLGDGNTDLPIMQPYSIDNGVNVVDIRKHMQYLPSGNLSSCTVARKAYLNSSINLNEFSTAKDIGGYTPQENWLMSFDGIRLRGAGLPTPWTFVDNSGVLAAHYVRGVYATIGMDAELILSPYLECRLSGATKNLYLSGYSAYPATPRADVAGSSGVSPVKRRPEDHLFERVKTNYGFGAANTNTRYFDKRFIKHAGGTSPVVTANVLTVTPISTSPNLAVGDWVMVNLGSVLGFIEADLYMFQVKTIGVTITFEDTFKYLDVNTVTWTDGSFASIWTAAAVIGVDIGLQFLGTLAQQNFTNVFLIVSYSTFQSTGYQISGIYPICWDSADAGISTSFGAGNLARPWAGVVTTFMADWYDTTVVKTTFPPLKGITNYKELLVGFDSNAIYFNDISLGGSTEMVSGLSNLVPYGSEYGDIVAICGSEDFLFVSRERKNYVITGDIAGSGFNITECDSAVPGAHNAKCVTNSWSGQVIFANSTGIFSIGSNGAIRDIGEEIKGLFFHENRDGNLFKKDIFKTLAQTRADGKDGGIFKFFLEDNRGFVILFMAKDSVSGINRSTTDSNMLVYNTRDNKWYEFDGYLVPSAEAINGKIVLLGINRSKEDGVMRGTEKQLIVTQRMTIDQPSMDKQVLQLKVYGYITPDQAGGRGFRVGQINDWEDFDTLNRGNWNTLTEYEAEAHEIYAHKKRLDSSKPVATSIILESSSEGSIALEGMEIEGVIIQTGLKK